MLSVCSDDGLCYDVGLCCWYLFCCSYRVVFIVDATVFVRVLRGLQGPRALGAATAVRDTPTPVVVLCSTTILAAYSVHLLDPIITHKWEERRFGVNMPQVSPRP